MPPAELRDAETGDAETGPSDDGVNVPEAPSLTPFGSPLPNRGCEKKLSLPRAPSIDFSAVFKLANLLASERAPKPPMLVDRSTSIEFLNIAHAARSPAMAQRMQRLEEVEAELDDDVFHTSGTSLSPAKTPRVTRIRVEDTPVRRRTPAKWSVTNISADQSPSSANLSSRTRSPASLLQGSVLSPVSVRSPITRLRLYDSPVAPSDASQDSPVSIRTTSSGATTISIGLRRHSSTVSSFVGGASVSSFDSAISSCVRQPRGASSPLRRSPTYTPKRRGRRHRHTPARLANTSRLSSVSTARLGSASTTSTRLDSTCSSLPSTPTRLHSTSTAYSRLSTSSTAEASRTSQGAPLDLSVTSGHQQEAQDASGVSVSHARGEDRWSLWAQAEPRMWMDLSSTVEV